MPSRGTYTIASREEGKAAQRDQSYRSCVLALIIFFLFCILLILVACFAGKSRSDNPNIRNDQDSVETAKIKGRLGKASTSTTSTVSTDTEIEDVEDIEKSKAETRQHEQAAKNGRLTDQVLNKSTQSPHTERYVLINTTENTKRSEGSATVPTWVAPETTAQVILGSTNSPLPVTGKTSEIVLNETNQTFENVTTSTDYPTSSETVEDGNSTTADPTERVTFESNSNETLVSDKNDTSSTELTETVDTTETIIIYANDSTSNGTEETPLQKSILYELPMIIDENATSTTEETKSTEISSTTADNYASSRANLEDSAKEATTSTSTLNETEEIVSNETEAIPSKYFTETVEDTETKNISTTSDSSTLSSLSPGFDDSSDTREKRQDQTEKDASDSPNFSSPTSESISTTTIARVVESNVQVTTLDSLVKKAIQSPLMLEDEKACNTPSCRRITSRMAYYMNHTADPCEDFYEYACGGLEADDLITDNDLSQRVYRTIERQARRSKKNASARFNAYYDSCINYETNFHFEQRINLAKEALDEIGKFIVTAESFDPIQVYTEIFTNMLKQNRPLFFDIVPDVNENRPDEFTLRIGPAVSDKLFQFANGPNPCIKNHEAKELSDVDLDRLYSEYENCKDDLAHKKFLSSVNQTLWDFGVYANVNTTSDFINLTLSDVETISTPFASEREIHEAYRSKKYSFMTLGELQRGWKLVNLTQLIESLTGLIMEPNTYLQVYEKEKLLKTMGKLEKLGLLELNNALLALYARDLHQDFVATKSSSDLHKHCSNLAMHFMAREASELYMSLFTDSEIIRMKTVMRHVFDELKETLRQNIKKSNWATEEGVVEMIKKVDGIEMSLPEGSAEKIEDANELDITDNYFTNTMKLMKKYRIMIYSVITKKPLDEIWSFFASPFDATAQTIYGLSRIVMPFGAVDWSTVPDSGAGIDYLTYATVGNLIAREIAHNFDKNGIRYWNGSKDSEFAVVTGSNDERQSYDMYVNCHTKDLYPQPVDMNLPTTGQRVSFTIPTLSVNERLSDVAGMRLASDTLDRLGLAATQHRLPWLNLNVNQFFYLAYAQTHCTKAPLTSSYVSLNEDRFLPSRIRVFVAVSNNNFVGGTWHCSEGFGISPDPGRLCPTFPHLDKTSDYDGIPSY